MNASYLITFRDVDGTRLPLLEAVTAWLAKLPRLEVIVVEQDAAPRLTPEHLGSYVMLLHVFNDGPFNKSWGLNVLLPLPVDPGRHRPSAGRGR